MTTREASTHERTQSEEIKSPVPSHGPPGSTGGKASQLISMFNSTSSEQGVPASPRSSRLGTLPASPTKSVFSKGSDLASRPPSPAASARSVDQENTAGIGLRPRSIVSLKEWVKASRAGSTAGDAEADKESSIFSLGEDNDVSTTTAAWYTSHQFFRFCCSASFITLPRLQSRTSAIGHPADLCSSQKRYWLHIAHRAMKTNSTSRSASIFALASS